MPSKVDDGGSMIWGLLLHYHFANFSRPHYEYEPSAAIGEILRLFLSSAFMLFSCPAIAA